jgi:hypothetical protein
MTATDSAAYQAAQAAKDRRISRLSLISSASTLYGSKIADPQLVLNAAKMWEVWVYDDGFPTLPREVVNGPTVAPAYPTDVTVPTPPPAAPTGPVCAVCGNPLTEVSFKTGKHWSVQELANYSQSKYGQLLCKSHYFGKKAPAV